MQCQDSPYFSGSAARTTRRRGITQEQYYSLFVILLTNNGTADTTERFKNEEPASESGRYNSGHEGRGD